MPDQCCQLAYPLRKLVLDDLHRRASEAQDSANTFSLTCRGVLRLRVFGQRCPTGKCKCKRVAVPFCAGASPRNTLRHQHTGYSAAGRLYQDLRSLNPVLHATTLHELRYNVSVLVFKEVTSLLYRNSGRFHQ